MSKFILVFSDGETWEEFNDNQQVIEVTNDAFERVNNGEVKPKNLVKGEVIDYDTVDKLWEFSHN